MEEASLIMGIAMVKTMPGQERSVYSALKDGDGIKSIHHAFGEYDFFVLIQAMGLTSLEKRVKEIKRTQGVAETRAIVSNLSDSHPIGCDIRDTEEIGSNSALCC